MKPQTVLAYAAAFIDGEGCIFISKRNQWVRNPVVTVTNTDRGIIEWLHATFHGGKTSFNLKTNGPKSKLVHRVTWGTIDSVYTFLSEILPYLRIKREQAEICLGVLRRRAIEKEVRGIKKLACKPSPMLADETACYHRIRTLNHRGIGRYEVPVV